MRIPSTVATLAFGLAALALPRMASSQEMRDLSIGLSSASIATAPIRLAKEFGLFEKQRLNVRFTVMDNANAATAALITKSFDMVASGPGELLAAQARGQKVVVIANTYANLGATLVLAKGVAAKLNVTPTAPFADRLKALDGLLIAVPSPTAVYTFAIKAAVQAAGVNVRFTYVNPSAMQAALESGAIQGYFTSAPLWTFPVIGGTAVAWISGPKGEIPYDYIPVNTIHLQMMRDVAQADPDTVRKIVAVFEDFSRLVGEQPARVKEMTAKLYPELGKDVLDVVFEAESPAWKTKPPTLADMKHDIAFMRASGVQLPQLDGMDPATFLFP